MTSFNPYLAVGGVLSAIAAALHVVIIVGGATWYRFFGAGEGMASRAQAGEWYPPLLTSGIALVLAGWALYAFSGAGLVRPLPFLRPILTGITAVYLLRGLALVPLLIHAGGSVSAFWWWSSMICLVYGIVHLVGLGQAWRWL